MVAVARDFQRAEALCLQAAEAKGIPGRCFSILCEPATDSEAARGCWVEAERYRDVEDEERFVFGQFGFDDSRGIAGVLRSA